MNLALVVLAVVAIVIVEVAYPYFFMYLSFIQFTNSSKINL